MLLKLIKYVRIYYPYLSYQKVTTTSACDATLFWPYLTQLDLLFHYLGASNKNFTKPSQTSKNKLVRGQCNADRKHSARSLFILLKLFDVKYRSVSYSKSFYNKVRKKNQPLSRTAKKNSSSSTAKHYSEKSYRRQY